MNTMRQRHARPGSSHGFTMIEVMVALLILSIALFGMLSITINSLKLSSTSNYRTIAGQQAYAMAETLRANPATLGAANATDKVFASAVGASDATCVNNVGCGRDAYIGNVIYMWQQSVQSSLPNGAGAVCRDSAAASNAPNTGGATINWNCDGNGQYVVKVCWNEARVDASASAATAAGYTSSNGLLCTWTGI